MLKFRAKQTVKMHTIDFLNQHVKYVKQLAIRDPWDLESNQNAMDDWSRYNVSQKKATFWS
mgnify:CR=1 FL=1